MTNALESLSAFESLVMGDSFANISTLVKAEPIKSHEEIRKEWLLQRWGRCTASNYHKLMTCLSKPNELPVGTKSYLNKIVAELLTDPIDIEDGFVSKAMQWGIDHEIEAITKFILANDVPVTDVRRIGDNQEFNQLGKYFGGTPDGIFFGNPIEVKCPDSVTHLDYLAIKDFADLKTVKPEYYWQLLGNCQALDSDIGWFISYDPRFKDEKLRLHYVQIDFFHGDLDLLETRQALAAEYIENRLAEFKKIK